MKRIFGIIVSICLVFSMFTVIPIVSNAAEPSKLYDFYYKDLYESNAPGGENDCEVEWKDSAMHVTSYVLTSKPGDPYFSLANPGGFAAEENPWMVIKLKNLSDITTFEMHYGTELHTVSGATVAHFAISGNDTEYKTYVVNIPKANLDIAYALNGPDGIAQNDGSTTAPIDELTESTFEGNVNFMRFDCFYKEGASGNVPEGSEMYIEYAAFFSSEEDAKAFAKTGPDRSGYVPPDDVVVPPEDLAPNKDAFINFSANAYPYYDEIVSFPQFSGIDVPDENEKGDGLLFTFVTDAGDPWALLDVTDLEVEASEWPVMQIKIKRSQGSPLTGQVYFTTSDNPNLGESQTATMKYVNTTDWQYINVNLNEKKNGTCEGLINLLRLDFFPQINGDAEVEVAQIAFFKSVDAAKQYIEKGGDFSELIPEPTPTPVATPTQTPTEKPSSTATTSPTAEVTKQPAKSEPEKTNTNTAVIIVVSVIAVVVIAAVVIIIVKKKKAK